MPRGGQGAGLVLMWEADTIARGLTSESPGYIVGSEDGRMGRMKKGKSQTTAEKEKLVANNPQSPPAPPIT